MKKIVVITIAVTLLMGVVACTSIGEIIPRLWDSMTVYGAESSNTTVVEGNIMAVFYTKAEERVVFWCINSRIIDRGDGYWNIYDSQGRKTIEGMNQALVGYGLYSYEILPDPHTNTYYLYELDLQDVTWQDLPYEQHVGKLIDVNPGEDKPVIIRRWYMGKTYDVPCIVEQDIVDMWTADPKELNIGEWVHVSFVIELPFTQEIHIAIVTGKIWNPYWAQ